MFLLDFFNDYFLELRFSNYTVQRTVTELFASNYKKVYSFVLKNSKYEHLPMLL